MSYKIAAVTEDGVKLSNHFGMAPTYLVFTVQADGILAEEERAKPHHAHHPEHGEHTSSPKQDAHADMFAPISDCQILLCGGMGTPAYHKAQAAGLEVVLIGGDIRSAVLAYLQGGAVSDLRRVHQH